VRGEGEGKRRFAVHAEINDSSFGGRVKAQAIQQPQKVSSIQTVPDCSCSWTVVDLASEIMSNSAPGGALAPNRFSGLSAFAFGREENLSISTPTTTSPNSKFLAYPLVTSIGHAVVHTRPELRLG